MRKIRLEPSVEFGSRADFHIIDVTDTPSRKRGTITIDYTLSDITQLKEHGLDYYGAMKYYRDRIYGLVKYYISGDWEDAGGLEKALDIISNHVKPHYEG